MSCEAMSHHVALMFVLMYKFITACLYFTFKDGIEIGSTWMYITWQHLRCAFSTVYTLLNTMKLTCDLCIVFFTKTVSVVHILCECRLIE